MARIIAAFTQFFDDAGDPLINGKLKFFEAGTNNTDKDTFKDPDLTIYNANPVLLDGSGRCPNVFGSGVYNVVLYTSDGVQVQPFDNVGGESEEGAFGFWVTTTVYSAGDIVRGTDNKYYQSITNNNQNNNPIGSASDWKELSIVSIYNANVTYSQGDSAYGSDGLLYFSLIDSNLNNNPVTQTDNTKWLSSDQLRFAVADGTADEITATLSPALESLKDGFTFNIRASSDNETATPTLNINGLGAKTIVANGGDSVIPGTISTDYLMNISYDLSNDVFVINNPSQIGLTIGIGQEWEDVTADRAASTNYTNTTNQPIMVNIYRTESALSASLTVDSVVIATVNSDTGVGSTVTAIIPVGSVYSFDGTFALWTELHEIL